MTRIPTAVRRTVSERSGGRCEYCRTPDVYRHQPFQVEHIRPIKHGGSSKLDNLAWACIHCNLRKGTDFAAFDDLTDEIVVLFNPRTQDWDEHFELDGALVVGKTPVGRATLRLLQLNHDDHIDTRAALIQANLW